MPLSEDEQRILSEIEQQLYASDPDLAKEIADSTVYRHAYRNIRWALLGFVAGLAMMIGTLHITFWLSFIGFLAMLGATLVIVHNAKRMGRAGLEQITTSMRGGGLRDYIGRPGQRFRDRFNTED